MRSTTIRAAAAGAALVLSGAAVVLSAATPSGADGHPVAHATVRNAGGAELGKVTFIGRGNHATRARVELTLPAGAPGLGSYHGLHIHANGECVGTSGFTTAAPDSTSAAPAAAALIVVDRMAVAPLAPGRSPRVCGGDGRGGRRG